MPLRECYEKFNHADKLNSPLDQDPFFGPKAKENKWLLLPFRSSFLTYR
jgi:hypothetical protein